LIQEGDAESGYSWYKMALQLILIRIYLVQDGIAAGTFAAVKESIKKESTFYQLARFFTFFSTLFNEPTFCKDNIIY
jgi:hypothetical protein